MKKTMKFTYALVLTLVLTIFGCNNDDNATTINEISVENLTITIDENPTNGQSIGTVQTDGDGTLSYSIASQTPSGALSINSDTGEVSIADATLFDFETNPVITATVSVVGASNSGTVTINLSDINEVSAQDLTATIDENPTNGQSVGTVDADGDGTVSFDITSQTPAGALDIDAGTGELTVADATLFDYETNPVITATISIDNSGNMTTATATIDLNDIIELSAQDLEVGIDENPTDGHVVGTIQVDGGGTLSFSIASQTPVGALAINAGTGELTVVDPNLFDFETNPVITANILIDDTTNTTTAIATINLNDIDEITVQDSTIAYDENPTNGDVVGSIQATANGPLNFNITFQNPAGALSIDQNTGELTVADASLFDFEVNPSMYVVVSVDNVIETVSANASININDLNEIGEFKHGGVVFYVDPSDNNNGLVCAVSNQFVTGIWGCAGTIVNTDSILGSGAANTIAIETACTTPGTVADIIANLNLNGYDDWFLPSEDELSEMYLNIGVVNATISANGGQVTHQFHWSSTEINATAARLVNLTTGVSAGSGKDGNIYFARAVRDF